MSDWSSIASLVVMVGALIVTIYLGKKASVVSAKQLAIEEKRDSERARGRQGDREKEREREETLREC